MICSATAFHAPEHLVVAVLTTDQNLAHWDWVKWLPHGQSAQQSDAVGPMRMVSTSLDELAVDAAADLSERPRFGADERPATPHILLVIDGAELPPGNHIVPPDGVHGVTVLDLPVRWDELEDASRLRLQFEGDRARGRPLPDPGAAAARRGDPGQGRPLLAGDRRGLRAPAHPAAHGQWRRRQQQRRSPRRRRLHGAAVARRRAPLRRRAGLAAAAGARPAAGADRHRRRRRRRTPRHQGVRPAGHGPARPRHRRDRVGQVGVPAHAGARPGDDALARAPQPGAGRLQGRRDLRRDVRAAARLGGDHQPRPGAHPRRPHAGRPVR